MIAEKLSSLGRQSGPEGLTRGLDHVGADPRTDLRAIADPRRAYPRLAGMLAAVAVPVVLITAGSRVGSGFAFNDIVLLGAVFLAIAIAAARLTWAGRDERWLFAIVAMEVVFVASLNTMTGGGGSPYFALYAPVLALAGWYLSGDLVAAAILLVGSSEVWRALAIERTGGADQVTIALPFYAALAAISWLTAHRLTVALVTIRQAQVQTAAILDGIRAIGAGPTDGRASSPSRSSLRPLSCWCQRRPEALSRSRWQGPGAPTRCSICGAINRSRPARSDWRPSWPAPPARRPMPTH